jgi:hypothetical protein
VKVGHSEAREMLEAYALGALERSERQAVDGHLAECAACRQQVAELEAVVAVLPETLPEQVPSRALRERLLAAASADLPAAPARPPLSRLRLRPVHAFAAALVFAFVAPLALAVDLGRQLEALRTEVAELADIADRVSQGGRWWYMAGIDAFAGSGGTLVDSQKDGHAFVLFHDLRPVANGRYAIWMIRANGAWVRAANFAPSGKRLQRVDVPIGTLDFVQCAVTVETSEAGPPAGALAMQSRVFGP